MKMKTPGVDRNPVPVQVDSSANTNANTNENAANNANAASSTSGQAGNSVGISIDINALFSGAMGTPAKKEPQQAPQPPLSTQSTQGLNLNQSSQLSQSRQPSQPQFHSESTKRTLGQALGVSEGRALFPEKESESPQSAQNGAQNVTATPHNASSQGSKPSQISNSHVSGSHTVSESGTMTGTAQNENSTTSKKITSGVSGAGGAGAVSAASAAGGSTGVSAAAGSVGGSSKLTSGGTSGGNTANATDNADRNSTNDLSSTVGSSADSGAPIVKPPPELTKFPAGMSIDNVYCCSIAMSRE